MIYLCCYQCVVEKTGVEIENVLKQRAEKTLKFDLAIAQLYRYNQKELVPESSKTQQTTLHKSNTFPKRHLATASLRQRHLSTKSSTPQPRRIRSLNCGRTPSTSKPSQRIYSFDDNNGSVFSDDDGMMQHLRKNTDCYYKINVKFSVFKNLFQQQTIFEFVCLAVVY